MAVPSNAPAGSVGAQPLASGLSLTDYYLGWQPALFPASSVLVQNSQFIALDHLYGCLQALHHAVGKGLTGLPRQNRLRYLHSARARLPRATKAWR